MDENDSFINKHGKRVFIAKPAMSKTCPRCHKPFPVHKMRGDYCLPCSRVIRKDKAYYITEPGTPLGLLFGFDKLSFMPGSYICVDEKKKTVVLSMIISTVEGQGALRKLVSSVIGRGFKCIIPTPIGNMDDIVKRWGFKKRMVRDPEMGEVVETWERHSPLPPRKEVKPDVPA